MATIASIENLAIRLLTDHGLYQQGWRFRWDNARRRAGACHYADLDISGSRHLLPPASDAEIRETLLHEIAHALTRKHGHGPVWKAKLIEIGGGGARTHQLETVKGRYDVVCERCGIVGDNHRSSREWRLRVYRHRKCGGRLSLVDVRPPKGTPTKRGLTVASNPATATRPCACGCGDTTKGGRYRPGHNSKHLAQQFALVVTGVKTGGEALREFRWSDTVALHDQLADRLDRWEARHP